MVAPTIDGVHLQRTGSPASSATTVLTTSLSDDIILAVLVLEGGGSPETVAGVSSSGGTTAFQLRSAHTDSSNNLDIEVWWAIASAPLSSITLTATFTGSVSAAQMVGIGVNGCNLSAPWDSNVSLPAWNNNTNQTGGQPGIAPTFSTDRADDLLIILQAAAQEITIASITGYTLNAADANPAGPNWTAVSVFSQGVSSPQSGVSQVILYGGGAIGVNTILGVDALTADASTTPTVGTTAGAGALAGVGAFIATVSAVGTTAGAGALAGVGNTANVVASGTMGGPIIITPMLGFATGVITPAPPPLPPAAPPFPFPFAQTLLLDQATWDLTVDIDGNIAVASLPYSAVQDACSAIRTVLGELWYDTTQGVPYNQIFGLQANLSFLKLQFSRAALTVPAVVSATTFITSLTNRALKGQVQLVLADGSTGIVAITASPGSTPAAFIVGHSELSGGDVS
jgi:hypothetical protein